MDELIDIDAHLAAQDGPSQKGWKGRARNMSVADGMMGVPHYGTIAFKVRIGAWRAFKDHVRSRGETVGGYARRAVAARLQAEGFDPEHLEGFIDRANRAA